LVDKITLLVENISLLKKRHDARNENSCTGILEAGILEGKLSDISGLLEKWKL